MVVLKSKKEFRLMEESGKVLGETLNTVKNNIKEGVTTKELNNIAEKTISNFNCVPAFKGYRGFPFTVCASVNADLVHGFPNDTPLSNSDIITVDCGVLKNNYYSDAAFTVSVGKVDVSVENLLTTTKKCLYNSITVFKENCKVGDISHTIEKVAEENNFNVVKDYGGHGIGCVLHEPPYIPNFGKENFGYSLHTGSAIAIEPILSLGDPRVTTKPDGWTATTVDGSLTAHFEHTVFLTENGPKILTNYE